MDENDILVESWPRHPGGLRIGVPIGIKVTHVPSGAFAVCDTERTMLRNREVALELLENALLERGVGPRERRAKDSSTEAV